MASKIRVPGEKQECTCIRYAFTYLKFKKHFDMVKEFQEEKINREQVVSLLRYPGTFLLVLFGIMHTAVNES